MFKLSQSGTTSWCTVCLLHFYLAFTFVDAHPLDFYLYDPYGTDGFLLVGDVGSILYCEVEEVLEPLFQISLNGSVVFDGENVTPPFTDTVVVDVAGSCLKINLPIVDFSLSGDYNCVVRSKTGADETSDTLTLEVFQSPQCRHNVTFSDSGDTDYVNLLCIHSKSQLVSLTLEGPMSLLVKPAKDLVTTLPFGKDKQIEHFKNLAVTIDAFSSFTCETNVGPSCTIKITEEITMSSPPFPGGSSHVRSSVCSITSKNTPEASLVSTDNMTTEANFPSHEDNIPVTAIVVSAIAIIAIIMTMVMLSAICIVRGSSSEKVMRHNVDSSTNVNYDPNKSTHSNEKSSEIRNDNAAVCYSNTIGDLTSKEQKGDTKALPLFHSTNPENGRVIFSPEDDCYLEIRDDTFEATTSDSSNEKDCSPRTYDEPPMTAELGQKDGDSSSTSSNSHSNKSKVLERDNSVIYSTVTKRK